MTQSKTLPANLLHQLHELLGERGVLTDPHDCAPYCSDWRGLYHGRTPAVLRPASTGELASVLRLCHAAGVAVVPQGGNTGMVGGAVPSETGDQFVLSLGRMNRVRAIDAVDMVIEVEAGVTLAAAREAADAKGCMLPLTIASEGTAQIGGVLATNAGGNNTLRYGNARDLVLGLEVVLADGSIWNGMRKLRKDNTGYCLRQLFVGSEGTLGVIAAATLKLTAKPTVTEVAFCAVPSVEAAVRLFQLFQKYDATALQAFEYMSGPGLELVLRHIPRTVRPLESPAAHYVLIELATTRDDADLQAAFEHVLGQAMENELLQDAAVAQSDAQRRALWMLREEHSEAQRLEGASIKNDVSVPISRIPAFMGQASAACERVAPGVRLMPFGHIGDGNIHFNLVQPADGDSKDFLALGEPLMDAVNEVVMRHGGSFSAEHGIGKLKTYLMPELRGGAELLAMQHIKQALDPKGILNPGKVLP